MKKISAVIITYNEEKNIERCLKSIVDLVDEIVVVDSFSTDNTEEICQEYNVFFQKHEWEGYVQTKNYANSLASNDVIFSLDADEAVSPELKESIFQIKNQNIDNQVFEMNRLMNYCGKWIRHGGWYPDAKIRIFDRRYVSWSGQKVHETLTIPSNFTIIKLKGDLLHYSFYSINEHRVQADKFALLSAQSAFENGKRVSNFSILVHVIWRFIRDFVFKMGFLDGRFGFIISKINAQSTYWKYDKLKKLYNNDTQNTEV